MSDLKIFNGGQKSTWCAGCGDFGILAGAQAGAGRRWICIRTR